MTRYSLYLGCMIPLRFPSIEKGARHVFKELGAELLDIEGYTCCPDPVITRLVGEKLTRALSFRNLALAEQKGVDLVVLCNGCYESLFEAEEYLHQHPEAAEAINQELKEQGLEYTGKLRIRHFLDVLKEDFGYDTIRAKVTKPRELRMAYHPGCHMLRGPGDMDINQRPNIQLELARVTGVEIVPCGLEQLCCGFPAMNVDEKFALTERLAPKLRKIAEKEVDALLLACPTCAAQFEVGQLMLRKYKEKFSIPCIHIMELLALSFGLPVEEMGLEVHRCKIKKLAEKIWV
jgi:heterodisulfide reductase subunit B2